MVISNRSADAILKTYLRSVSYSQHNLKETISLEKNLTKELKRKEEYIEELVQKQAILEQQLQEGLDIYI